MITFYTNPQSRGRIARWMLEEVGQPYETVVLGFGPPMKAAEYLALNPMGKVPTVVHDGKVVTECAAICAYLADAFPAAGLAPAPADRAAYYRWLLFAAGPVEAAVTNKALNAVPTEDQMGFVGYGSFDLALGALEKAVSATPYVAGDRFSAADVYVGSQIGWGMQFGTLPSSPPLVAYWNRIKDRPARQSAETLDNALIPENQP